MENSAPGHPAPLPWVLAGRRPDDLRARARALGARVEATPPEGLARLAAETAELVEPLPHRAVVFAGAGEAAGELDALAGGAPGAGTIRGEARGEARVAFVFSPLRSEYPGMALDLSDLHPAFARRLAACEELLEPLLGWSLGDVLRGRAGAPPFERLDVSQPVLFAVSAALAELWGGFGVRPEAVLGHSVGEIAAAATCGALSLDDAARVVATWGRSSMRLEGTGTMASLPLAAAEVERRLEPHRGRLSISGLNAPGWTAVSGDAEAVESLLAELAEDGVKGRSMGIGAPGHSAAMAPIDGWFREELATISPRSVPTFFCSAVEGGPIDPGDLGAGYWSRNLRQPVLFEAAIRSLREAGFNALIEIGPRPILTGAVEEILAGDDGAVAIGGWEQGEARQFQLQLAEAHVLGVGVDWRALCRERRGRPAVAGGAGGGGRVGTLRERLLATAPDARARLALEVVRGELGAVLGTDAVDLAEARPFRDLGLDSRGALALRNRLVAATGVELAKTVVFDCPTLDELASHLHDLALGREAAPARRPGRGAAAGADEPIAIVGMGCRYPGGIGSPGELWELVAAGRDATGEFPADRGWNLERLFDPDPDRPRTSHVSRGGFIAAATEFDAEFFAIGPREARAMDPQQRLLLECSWEALEAAGIDPTALRGEPAGVFAGAFASGYGPPIRDAGEEIAGHLVTGTTTSVIAGRVAYSFGLEGPAMTVDTACSSSLVAVHLACRALRDGECSLALAGGVTVMPTPDLFVEFSRKGVLAPDGRCKPFGADADGTAWSEGCGLLVLEPLAEARRRGRRVLAVVRGSAVNQDGASNGLTAPRARAQERVIRQALADAGLDAAEVDAVEAHGTGTPLGDPIEARTLLATYGRERAGEAPLWLGSIKSNIGHSSAAAGVAGAIKMVMAMDRATLPRTLHAERASPDVDWEAGRVELLRRPVPWPRRSDRPRCAAVSSFGISGTNAHLLLGEAPAPEEPPSSAPTGRPAPPLLLSARDEEALRAQAERLAAHLRANPSLATIDVAHSLARRARFDHRAALVGGPPALLAGLDALAAGREGPGLVRGKASPGRRAAFVFPAETPPWPGTGTALWRDHPPFAEQMRACEEVLAEFVDWSLAEVLRDGAALARTEIAQPALFATMVSLAALWRRHGVEPIAVLGEAAGEVAAAHVAGALSLADAARVVALRSQATARIAGGGDGGTGSAAVWTDEVEARLRSDLAPIAPRNARLPIFSALTGARIDGGELDAAHWSRDPRAGRRLSEATAALAGEGIGALVEISPRLRTAAADGGTAATQAPPSRESGSDRFALSLAGAHVNGVEVDWSRLTAGGRLVELPPYPFQRRRHWLEPGAGGGPRPAGAAVDHPLLSADLDLAEGRRVLSGRIALDAQPWLADHAILGNPVLPGTAFVELAAVAGRRTGLGTLAELTLEAPLALPAAGAVSVQVLLATETAPPRRRELVICSRPEGEEGGWVRHASGVLAEAVTQSPSPPASWPPDAAEPLDVARLRARLDRLDIDYGPAFRGLRAAWRRGNEAFAEVALADDLATTGFVLHPALADAALHLALDLDEGARAAGGLPLPFSWRDVRLDGPEDTRALRVRIALEPKGGIELTGFAPDGSAAFAVGELRTRAVDPRRLGAGAGGDAGGSLLTLEWVAVDGDGGHRAADTIVAEVATPADPGSAARRGLALVQELLADARQDDRRLAFVTRGAVAAADGDEVPDPAAAALWGLVRSAQAEHPDRFALLDVDEDTSERVLERALESGEPQLALRGGRLLAPRLSRAAAAGGGSPIDPDGTVLITGGTGLLGRRVAAHLVRNHGARHVLLVSRGGAAGPAAAELAELGDAVEVVACDVSDRAQLGDLLADIAAERPLTAVVHAAGVLDDGTVEGLTAKRLERVLAPKAGAAWHLHELTEGADLRAFVLFSSLAGTIGSAGQASYAAASASLDSLAAHRRARGQPALSLAWGLWEEASGMTGALSGVNRARMARHGVAPMPTERALRLLDAALAAESPLLFPVRLDLAALRSLARSGALPALFAELAPAAAGRRAGAPEPVLARRLAGLPGRRREQLLLDLVRGEVAAVLGHDSPGAVDPGRSFKDLGFDSLAAVDLRNGLNRATGLALSATLVFDHPTPRAVAGRIGADLDGGGLAPPAPDGEPVPDGAEQRALSNIDGLDLAGLVERGLAAAGGDRTGTPD